MVGVLSPPQSAEKVKQVMTINLTIIKNIQNNIEDNISVLKQTSRTMTHLKFTLNCIPRSATQGAPTSGLIRFSLIKRAEPEGIAKIGAAAPAPEVSLMVISVIHEVVEPLHPRASVTSPAYGPFPHAAALQSPPRPVATLYRNLGELSY